MEESREPVRPPSNQTIPSSWTKLPLNHTDWFVSVGVPAFAGRRPYFSTGSIQASDRVSEGEFGFADRPARANRIGQKWDVFQARMAGTSKAVIVDDSLNRSLFSTGFMQWRPPVSPETLGRWLYYAVQTPDFLAQRDRLASGTTQVALNDNNLARTTIPIAPLAEQRRIIDAIETRFARLDAAVGALERARENLRRYRASVLEAACSGELVSKESSWRETNLADLAEIRSGVQKQPSRRPKEHKYPFLRVANVLRGRLELDEVHEIELFGGELERLRLQPNDLLIVEGNGSRTEIGRMAIWDGSIPECVHQNHVIRARLRPVALPSFVQAYWNSPTGSAQIMAVSSSTSGLYTLSAGKVGKIRVPLPSVEEQEKIVMELERRLSVADEAALEVEHGLTRCSHLRDAVLRSAFEGRLVPQDPNDEPASAFLERIKRVREPTAKAVRRARIAIGAD